jgi:C-terminal processing protease CtpA/Prc
MRTLTPAVALAVTLVLNPGCHRVEERPDLTAALTFEGDTAGFSPGWHVPHSSSTFLDSVEVHGGRYSVRIEREAGSPGDFTPISIRIPRDFGGKTIGLRGWAKSRETSGSAGLWLRLDGATGTLAIDSMQDRPIQGTSEWQRYDITLPLDPAARTVYVGALLVGEGILWVDDLEVLVDGRPLARAPAFAPPKTVFDKDREFDRGSGIRDTILTEAQVGNLAVLCKVWGFLKYHHPRITSGERHFDYDLFRVMPRVLAARDPATAQRVLEAWVASLGRIRDCAPCAELPANAAMQPRLDWIEDEALLGHNLSRRLRSIYANRPEHGSQFYVRFFPGAGHPDFSTEAPYRPAKDLPDPGFRLLGLFRFWNMAEYWFPYRDVMAENWDQVLRDAIPTIAAVADRVTYGLELARVVARLHDGHANVWRAIVNYPPSGPSSLPFITRFVEGKEVVTSYSNPSLGEASGLLVGDVIEAVDGVPVETIATRSRPWYGVSNETAYRNVLSLHLTRGSPGRAELRIRRGGQVMHVQTRRVSADSLDQRVWNDHGGRTVRRLSGELAYLTLSSVDAGSVSDYLRDISGASALIIDIRTYPSASMIFALGQHLVDAPTPFVRVTRADPVNPGAFLWADPSMLEPKQPRIEARVAVLVDEKSMSASEYAAMAFRAAPGAIVVGSQTAGADGNLSMLDLPGFLKTGFSGIGIFYPDKRPTQQIGIVPDIEVRPTIAGIRGGRDEVLEAAVVALLKRPITRKEYEALKAP